ncbi:unnamed protein product, partial [Phaeothamnion confervicola]
CFRPARNFQKIQNEHHIAHRHPQQATSLDGMAKGKIESSLAKAEKRAREALKASKVALVREAAERIAAASAREDLFESLVPSFFILHSPATSRSSDIKSESSVTLTVCEHPTATLIDAAYALTEENMRALYETASWGWKAKKKRAELAHPNARFLVASDASNRMVGFTHFRFDWDDEDEPAEDALYVFELQVASDMRRRGIGRRMMQVAEMLANKCGMSKTMLTVFKFNVSAMSFYVNSLKYCIDDACSPSANGVDDADFEVLSKPTAI